MIARAATPWALLLLAPGLALAHGADPHGDTPRWSFDPVIMLPLLLAGALYAAGCARLWHHRGAGRGIGAGAVACYALGWLALLLALCSPLHWWGEHLFTSHMIEHEVVMVLAAPLLVLGRPVAAALWAFPHGTRQRLLRGLRRAGAGRLLRRLTAPGLATLLHAVAIWLWHWPPLFDATVTDTALHRAQHLSFLAAALLFWWAVLRRAHPALGALHLLATMLHTGLLGALLTFAPRVLYAQQTQQAALWGLTPLEDQQIAGLVMWAPGGIAYVIAALALLARWIRRSGAAQREAAHGTA